MSESAAGIERRKRSRKSVTRVGCVAIREGMDGVGATHRATRSLYMQGA